MLLILDIFFFVFHLALILFNLIAWIWPRTRKWHLASLLLTAASWGLLGIWYGWGYCPLTDWHWAIKEQRGEINLPNSFIKYYADKITGMDLSSQMVDRITLSCLIAATLASVYVNFIKRKRTINTRKTK